MGVLIRAVKRQISQLVAIGFCILLICLYSLPFPSDPPIMSTRMHPKDVYELCRYTPSLEAAAIFAALLAGTTIVYIYQLVKTKAWHFTPFVVGGDYRCFPPLTLTLRILYLIGFIQLKSSATSPGSKPIPTPNPYLFTVSRRSQFLSLPPYSRLRLTSFLDDLSWLWLPNAYV